MALKTIGGLWEKKKGERTYLTGVLDLGALGQVNIGVFPNEQKEDNQPDFRVTLFHDDKFNGTPR